MKCSGLWEINNIIPLIVSSALIELLTNRKIMNIFCLYLYILLLILMDAVLFFAIQKWTQENSRLPEHLKRIIPQRPETPNNISVDDWNRLAWETTQVNSK